jgi:glycosyltransferase involved in cell wall biosynthesis
MLDFMTRLTRSIAHCYNAGTAEMTYRLLRDRSGPRDFRRVVVVAPLGRHNGLASGARLQWASLRAIGIDAELVDAAPALRNPLFRVGHRPGSVYVVHAAGPQSAAILASVLPPAASAYRIAYWAWELPDPPPDWSGCERHFAEIWTPSGFAARSLARLVQRPLYVVPHHVPTRPMRVRNFTDPFTVLAMADTRSSLARKNPAGALLAFREAFGSSPTARFLLKLHGRPDELDEFRDSFAPLLRAPNVELIRDYLDDAALADLYRRADAFLSLHRAEGFGLPMLEAMANGVPVIATAWSGNLEYMDPSNSELVPYELVPVADGAAIYSGSVWAEPNVGAAAQALRRLADEPDAYSRLAAAAHRRVLTASPQFPFPRPGGRPLDAGSMIARSGVAVFGCTPDEVIDPAVAFHVKDVPRGGGSDAVREFATAEQDVVLPALTKRRESELSQAVVNPFTRPE